ncbi:uncharacterized protein LOC131676259 [Topomyia yanbarensis]|uniref:uncharacterized protein LOC131676259 n=1 Tax=Topomyia yanbarensis TaxID=2498891 RepID=UPI00273C974D|nr:uncharacterized protein LOC131676259 [Topomyia yanbarensis]
MKNLIKKRHASLSMREIIETENSYNRKNFEFNLQKNRIDSIIDELFKNLKLFFSVNNGIQSLTNRNLQHEFNKEITNLLNSEVEQVISYLLNLKDTHHFEHDETDEKYLSILEAVENLRQLVPSNEEVLLPFYRQRSESEKLQWITGILVNKAKIRSLSGLIRSTQNAIDETKLELFVLNERSPREIQDIVEESELALIELKVAGDREFTQLQEETAKTVLGLDQHKEYQDLIDSHSQKRRKITKLIAQLQLWIKKYGKFVGEPMKELLTLETELEAFPGWLDTVFNPQEERYNQLNFNVDILKAELIEELVEQFRIEHAARIIQRGWRRVLAAKKRAKKKRKKGKGSKKGKKKNK